MTARSVASKKAKGKYADGGGLYLQVGNAGNKSWVFRYTNGTRTPSGHFRQIEMGIGSLRELSLAEAREQINVYHAWLADGKDPKTQRDAAHNKNRSNQLWTFDKCAKAYIDAHSPSWKNKKHAKQWHSTLAQYASPIFGSLPVEEITAPLIMRVLEPIWLVKTETASRVRGRIERVLSWAIVHGHRAHPNPALWRGNLAELLPAPNTVTKVTHHPALPYQELDLFMQALEKHKSLNAQALMFTILTACRTNEVLSASWDEIDFTEKTWTIPADRMKSKRPHRVPLSNQAIKLLKGLHRESGWIFPSAHHGKHLSNMAMLNLINRQLKRPDLTVHGFRSTFRDWVAEQTNYQRELAESALAHVLSDKTEAAYQRGDMLEKRADLMQAWADFANNELENVIPIKRKKN